MNLELIAYKKQLKKQLEYQISKVNISFDDIKQIQDDHRKEFVNNKLIEVDATVLEWALNKHIVLIKELTTDSYYINNYKLNELIIGSGLLAVGGLGSATAFTATLGTATIAGTGLAGTLGTGFLASTAANIGLGTMATTATAVTATTIIATIAPVAFALASIYGIVQYNKNNARIEALEEDFKKGQRKILDFYLAKINKIHTLPLDTKHVNNDKTIITEKRRKKSSPKKVVEDKTSKITKPQTLPLDKQHIKEKDIVITERTRTKQSRKNSDNKSPTIAKKTTSKKQVSNKNIEPIKKTILKDSDYDKCVVKYDNKLNICTIKYEDDIRDKKNGLHGDKFKSFVDKIPPLISEIFNESKMQIVFVGVKSDFIELKNACKLYEEKECIEINISFRDINKKELK